MTIHQLSARSAPLDRATPPDNATTHTRSRAGDDEPRFAYVLERRNEPEPRPWLESNLAMMILCAAIFALTWMLADHVWTQITTEPGILTE